MLSNPSPCDSCPFPEGFRKLVLEPVFYFGGINGAFADPMSAVPEQSRLWMAEEPDGARVITWDNFFLGGDTNCLVNAQIRLYSNGDFTTRSNDVETVCRRVNPDDLDGDGLWNEGDPISTRFHE